MPLLLVEEALSFCHQVSFFFFTEGVSGTDGIYIHCTWVTRGGSPLSALSKATLPLISGPQAPLVTHWGMEGEDGFLCEVLSQFISGSLLPLCHSFGPDVPVHDDIKGPRVEA
jgi:hypothetical protein